jgi:hypothetical protein
VGRVGATGPTGDGDGVPPAGSGGVTPGGGPIGGALRGGLDGGGELGGALDGGAELGGALDGGAELGGALDGGAELGGAPSTGFAGAPKGPTGLGVGAPSGPGPAGSAGRGPAPGIPTGIPGVAPGGSMASFFGTPIAATCWTRAMKPPRRAGSAGSGVAGAPSGEAGGVTFSPFHSRNTPSAPQNVSVSAFMNPHFLQTIIDRLSTSRRDLQGVNHVRRLRGADQPVERARVNAGNVVHIYAYCHTRLRLSG